MTHARWNAIAHRITDKRIGFTPITGGGVLTGLVLMPFVAVPAAVFAHEVANARAAPQLGRHRRGVGHRCVMRARWGSTVSLTSVANVLNPA